MAYEGKFTDRSPYLRPAGKVVYRKDERIGDCLVHEVTEEEGHPFVCKTGPLDYKLPPKRANFYKGFNSEVRECMQPLVDEGFMNVLTRELQETVYDSYWKKPLGSVSDPVPNLPPGMDYNNVCFGRPMPKDITAGELVNPNKSYVDVMEESTSGHEMYKGTHQDYYPGEQLCRNYIEPFDKERIWGVGTPSDPKGGCIKKVLSTDVDEKTLVSKILADYVVKTKPQLGKVFAPNNNVACVPEDHAFGRLNDRGLFGVSELLKDCPPSLEKLDFLDQISHVNVLRQQIANRRHPFSYRDLRDTFHQFDQENIGCLNLKHVYDVLSVFKVYPDRFLFENLLKKLNILNEDGDTCYEQVVDLLNVNVLFPDLNKLNDVPKEFLHFETTNKFAQKYHCSDETKTEDIPKAGIHSKPHISIESLLSPNIFSSYGLQPKDFFISKSEKYFRTLLHRIGCEIDENMFNKIWEKAKDKNGCVCVQSFLRTLSECTI